MSSEPHNHDHDHHELHRQVAQRLMHNEQRYTSSRRTLVDALAAAGRPVTLPDITELAPGLAQSSAYRNLDVLERCGIARRLNVGGEHTHFELAEPLLGHHHHLICNDCGSVTDIHLADDLETLVDQHLGQAAQAADFTPTHHSLDLHGLCTDCT